MDKDYIYHYCATGMRDGVEKHLAAGFITISRAIDKVEDYKALTENLRLNINKNSETKFVEDEIFVKSFSLVSVN
jgi:hypothetical protein